MSQSVVSDNWSLQNIAELLTEGLEDDITYLIDIDSKVGKYKYKEIASASINIEAFFDFITDIILRDQILVERDTVHAWKENGSALSKVTEAAVIREYPLSRDKQNLEGSTARFVKALCITDDLKHDHEQNRLGWIKDKNSPHKYLSQVLWGGAGMLARSFVYEKAYTPHPVRKRLFINAGLALSSDNAVINLNALIKAKRVNFGQAFNHGDELYSLAINIPPLPIRVIQESNSVGDLIPIALQLRQEYQELRDWLGCYQQAMSDGSYKNRAKFEKVIRSISMYVDSLMGSHDSNAPTFTTGIGVLKVAVKGQPLNAINNQFGVRAMVNKLIVGRSGNAELKKLLGFYGHRDSAVGINVLEHFSKTTI